MNASESPDTELWIRFANCCQSLLYTAEGASLGNIRQIVEDFVHPDLPIPPLLLRTIVGGGLLSCIRDCTVNVRANLTPLLMEFATRHAAIDALWLECLALIDHCQ